MPRVPVIALTGFLGSGKTTLLNHLLGRPGSRVGVVVNDFGDINVDSALVSGQVDEAASIAGGCICCLPDAGGLDEALTRLTAPRLRLDAVLVEASGAADPVEVARLIRFTAAANARPGGVIDVVDALEHTHTVDTSTRAPARYAAATLVVVNKLDLVAEPQRRARCAAITARVTDLNPAVPVVAATRGRIDPALVFDVTETEDPPDQLPLAELARHRYAARSAHVHASAVTVPAAEPVDPAALLDLLEAPPAGVYRMKGCVPVRTARTSRRYLVNLVGRTVHLALAPRRQPAEDGLVAIGLRLDQEAVDRRLRAALAPASGSPTRAALDRLHRSLTLSR